MAVRAKSKERAATSNQPAATNKKQRAISYRPWRRATGNEPICDPRDSDYGGLDKRQPVPAHVVGSANGILAR